MCLPACGFPRNGKRFFNTFMRMSKFWRENSSRAKNFLHFRTFYVTWFAHILPDDCLYFLSECMYWNSETEISAFHPQIMSRDKKAPSQRIASITNKIKCSLISLLSNRENLLKEKAPQSLNCGEMKRIHISQTMIFAKYIIILYEFSFVRWWTGSPHHYSIWMQSFVGGMLADSSQQL